MRVESMEVPRSEGDFSFLLLPTVRLTVLTVGKFSHNADDFDLTTSSSPARNPLTTPVAFVFTSSRQRPSTTPATVSIPLLPHQYCVTSVLEFCQHRLNPLPPSSQTSFYRNPAVLNLYTTYAPTNHIWSETALPNPVENTMRKQCLHGAPTSCAPLPRGRCHFKLSRFTAAPSAQSPFALPSPLTLRLRPFPMRSLLT